jgi:hypothetical protein
MNRKIPVEKRSEILEDGIDYYLENGLLVFTAYYLNKRGYCCKSGCRHCPFGFSKLENTGQKAQGIISSNL